MIMFTPWLRLTAVKNEIAEANAVGYEALTPTKLESDKASGYIDALNYAFTHPDIRMSKSVIQCIDVATGFI